MIVIIITNGLGFSLIKVKPSAKSKPKPLAAQGASGNARADLLDRQTVQVVKSTDQRDFYRNIIGLNRSLLRLIVQPKRSDRGRSPCAASGLGFDCADGLTFIKEKPSPLVIIITITKLTPHPLRSR